MILRKATDIDRAKVWNIIQQAIASRKEDGSTQWQDGYPNQQTIINDIGNEQGYVYEDDQEILMYGVIQLTTEPTYNYIEGSWINPLQYAVIHRLAVAPTGKGMGLAKRFILEAEKVAFHNNAKSLRIDTHEDNLAMLHILKRLNYTFCGKIFVREEPRSAFEKLLDHDHY